MEIVRELCPICKTKAQHIERNAIESSSFVSCPVCGKYCINDVPYCEINDKLAAYMYYHNGKINGVSNTGTVQNIIGCKAYYDKKVVSYLGSNHVTDEVVNSWYPRNFSEKVDMILLALANKTEYLGQELIICREEINSLFFLKGSDDEQVRNGQLAFFFKYFGECKYNKFDNSFEKLKLEPAAWKRIDELRKNSGRNSKTAFIAMSFDADMKPVREQIKAAIVECGYEPIIMDEIEHNGQIVPEMLYQIRQAKFVVADLTKKNNGAYYEAGYALGNGKPVIHLCNGTDFQNTGHFDVKQICTILWGSESEIKDKLVSRIKATIG